AVMIVAAPAGTVGSLHLQDGIDDAQRILDERVSALPDPIADELEEPRVDDVLRREVGALARGAIANRDRAAVRVLVRRGIVRVGGMDADEVAADAGQQRALRRDGPRLDVLLEDVGVLLKERGGRLVAALARELRRARERGDVG